MRRLKFVQRSSPITATPDRRLLSSSDCFTELFHKHPNTEASYRQILFLCLFPSVILCTIGLIRSICPCLSDGLTQTELLIIPSLYFVVPLWPSSFVVSDG